MLPLERDQAAQPNDEDGFLFGDAPESSDEDIPEEHAHK
eukprot:gene1683-2879_t